MGGQGQVLSDLLRLIQPFRQHERVRVLEQHLRIRRILLLERGGEVPSEPENWSPAAVWKDLRYRTTERWVDADGVEFQPYTHYNVGGNTKYWGSVLYRLRREDFDDIEHRDGVSPAWPIRTRSRRSRRRSPSR